MATLIAALLVLVPAPANDAAPAGVPPQLQYLKFNNGKLETTVTVTEHIAVQRTVAVNVNGVNQAREVTEMIPRFVTKTAQIEASNAEVYGADGKQIEKETWQKRMAQGAIVLVSADGQMPDPAYLRVLKEGTLIVVYKPVANVPAPLTK